MKIFQSIKKLSLVLCLVLAPCITRAQPQITNPNGYNKFYFDNGKISSEGTLRDGKPDGYWKTYFMNGKLKSEGNRVNFLLDSTWKFYNEEGKLVLTYMYKQGKKNGFKKTYDPKEDYLVQEENYVADIKQGYTNIYYKNGKLRQKINFIEGKEEGMSYEYAEDGTIITLTEYKYGFIRKQERINRRDENGKQGIWKEFYDNGVIKTEGTYSDDKKDGYFKEYNDRGGLVNTTKYVGGVLQKNVPELARVDIKNDYHPNGKLKYSGGFKEGDIAEGVHRTYDSTGKILEARVYRDGELLGVGIVDERGNEQGPWKEYHPNGKLKGEGEFKDAKRIGPWEFFHPNGKVEQKGVYDKKGKAQGTWKWYYEDGNLLREEVYVNDLREGMMTEYSDSGSVITKGEYVEGLREGKWVYELGDYREEGVYKGDRRDGVWHHYYTPGGTRRFEGSYLDGTPEGKHTYYYPNKKVMMEGKYSAGGKEGDWRYYSEDGTLFLTITFQNDKEIKFDGVKIRPTQEEVDAGKSDGTR